MRARRARRAVYSYECVDFRIAPMFGACYHASKIGTRIQITMLRLHNDWSNVNEVTIVRHLLAQAESMGVYRECSDILIRACMELLIESRGWNRRPDPISIKMD